MNWNRYFSYWKFGDQTLLVLQLVQLQLVQLQLVQLQLVQT